MNTSITNVNYRNNNNKLNNLLTIDVFLTSTTFTHKIIIYEWLNLMHNQSF